MSASRSSASRTRAGSSARRRSRGRWCRSQWAWYDDWALAWTSRTLSFGVAKLSNASSALPEGQST
eukprot:8394336-Alexandrium_andersonii.AAC.1